MSASLRTPDFGLLAFQHFQGAGLRNRGRIRVHPFDPFRYTPPPLAAPASENASSCEEVLGWFGETRVAE